MKSEKELFDLIENHVPRKRTSGFGITVSEYAKKKGVSNQFSRRVLNELVETGVLKKEKMVSNRSICDVYFEAEKKK